MVKRKTKSNYKTEAYELPIKFESYSDEESTKKYEWEQKVDLVLNAQSPKMFKRRI